MNNRLIVGALALALFTPLGAMAQDEDGPGHHASENAVTTSLKALHDITKQSVMATAEMVSEDLYGFQPTEDVRTLGGILAHIANAQFMFCAAAGGVDSPNSQNYEETATTKAQVIEALQAGFAFCDEVYETMTDEKGAGVVQFFGQEMAASGVLAFNAAHNYEHYGNLVTYMRINGITPPSSM